MRIFPILFLAGMLASTMPTKKKTTRANPPGWLRMRHLIRGEAIRQGVPTEIALATARVESNFDPTREGDLNWHMNQKRFEKFVPKNHPFRDVPELWHSYGLFQLLAPFHVHANEDPRILLDPKINTERGVRVLRRLLNEHNGDPNKVRLHYTNGDAADALAQGRILQKWHQALGIERLNPRNNA